MKKSTHRHRAGRREYVCFRRPVEGAKQNRAALGGTCRIEVCSCGAVRVTDVNGLHI